MARLSIAVVLCTYNGEPFLEEQLESLARQRRAPERLVVIDDGSTDGTLAILEDFARSAPFPVGIRRNERNLGYVRNFERAIGIPTEEVIALCDQDDVWVEEKLERLAGAFETDPDLDLVFTDAQLVDAALEPLGYRLWETVQFTADEQEAVRAGRAFEVLLRHNRVTGATLALRRSARELCLPIPSPAVHDEWLALVLSAVSRVTMIPEPLILYRQHGGNQLGARWMGLRDRWRRARRQGFEELQRRRAVLLELRRRLGRGGPGGEGQRLLQETLEHLEVRLGLPSSRLRRVRSVAGAWLRGEYRRHANGAVSAVRDLVA